jgi:hypothetical protein
MLFQFAIGITPAIPVTFHADEVLFRILFDWANLIPILPVAACRVPVPAKRKTKENKIVIPNPNKVLIDFCILLN